MAMETSVRQKIVRSHDFLKFKKKRIAELRSSKTDNPYIQCVKDEHGRIKGSGPSFKDYYSVRHPEYLRMESEYTINKMEACVEREYIVKNCDEHTDKSYICEGTGFTVSGPGQESQTAPEAINSLRKSKRPLMRPSNNNYIIENAIRSIGN